MKIEIHSDMRIKDLKKQFHASFPFLKIEFFDAAHRMNESSARADMIGNEVLLSDLIPGVEGAVEFTALTGVHAFEQLFSTQFGLHVQVFRNSGGVYVETTATDDWSLGQQNAEGKSSFEGAGKAVPPDFTDRDQWE